MNELDSPKPTTRSYRFTPDRFIVGLLAVEVFFLLSERFRWFAFNERKGHTVLMAAAAVSLGILLLILWSGLSLLLRRRFQFGIRSLLVLVLAIAIQCSWLRVKVQQAREQQEAVEAIEKDSGHVFYDDAIVTLLRRTPEPYGRRWLRQLLGKDFFADVVLVHWKGETEADMENLRGLTSLSDLRLSGTQVTDAGLEHLEGLTSLESLELRSTQVTDAGMENLRGLTSLLDLRLSGTQVTDAGLEHLEGLTSLEELWLNGAQVTDAGLEHLEGLTSLRELWLEGTLVTDEGFKKLKEALPECVIFTDRSGAFSVVP